MNVLLTGGAGYIGSHTAVECLEAGHEVVVFDNLSNSSVTALDRVAQIAGRRVEFVQGDIRDRAALRALFEKHAIDAVVHFAGLKAVGESVEKPLLYYDNNIGGSIALFEVMAEAGVRSVVFSSSATVYGDPATVPITEDFPLSATNPYGWSKLRGIPNNLMPYIAQVAVGRRPHLNVFGGDYPTPDGTGVRDYIHVVDLARGHVAALNRLHHKAGGVHTWNLGTGRGVSVLDMVRAFEAASGKKVPYEIVARRPGDVAQCWADPSRAAHDLGWRAIHDLPRMCADAWRWQSNNPDGYA